MRNKSPFNGIASYLHNFNIPTEKPNHQSEKDVISVVVKFISQFDKKPVNNYNEFAFIQDNFGEFVKFVKENYKRKNLINH